MVKLVDTLDLDPSAYVLESSSLSVCNLMTEHLTKKNLKKIFNYKRSARFELATFDFEKQCSIQLS